MGLDCIDGRGRVDGGDNSGLGNGGRMREECVGFFELGHFGVI